MSLKHFCWRKKLLQVVQWIYTRTSKLMYGRLTKKKKISLRSVSFCSMKCGQLYRFTLIYSLSFSNRIVLSTLFLHFFMSEIVRSVSRCLFNCEDRQHAIDVKVRKNSADKSKLRALCNCKYVNVRKKIWSKYDLEQFDGCGWFFEHEHEFHSNLEENKYKESRARTHSKLSDNTTTF